MNNKNLTSVSNPADANTELNMAFRLERAISEVDLQAVKDLIANGFNPNYCNDALILGYPLMMAIREYVNNSCPETQSTKNRLSIISALLDAGADPDRANALKFVMRTYAALSSEYRYNEDLVTLIILLLNHPTCPANPNGSDNLLFAQTYLDMPLNYSSNRGHSLVMLLRAGACPSEKELMGHIRAVQKYSDVQYGVISHILTIWNDWSNTGYWLRYGLVTQLLDLGFDVPSEFTKKTFIDYLNFLTACRGNDVRKIKQYIAQVERAPKDFANLALKAVLSGPMPMKSICALFDAGIVVNEFDTLGEIVDVVVRKDDFPHKTDLIELLLDNLDDSKRIGCITVKDGYAPNLQRLLWCHPNSVIGRLRDRLYPKKMPGASMLGAPLGLSFKFMFRLELPATLAIMQVAPLKISQLLGLQSIVCKRIASITALKTIIDDECTRHAALGADVDHLTVYSTELLSQLGLLARIAAGFVSELEARDKELRDYCNSMSTRPSMNLSALLLRESGFFMGSELPEEIQAIIINNALRNDFDKHFPDQFFKYLTDAIIDRAKKTTLKSKTGGPVVFEDVLSTRTWLPGGVVIKKPRPDIKAENDNVLSLANLEEAPPRRARRYMGSF